jgi:MFS family permease
VTIVGSIGAVLTSNDTLAFPEAQIGLLGSVYIAGAVAGSPVFGYLTDRLHVRLWGPGRFGLALGRAVASGRVRRDGRLYRTQSNGAAGS